MRDERFRRRGRRPVEKRGDFRRAQPEENLFEGVGRPHEEFAVLRLDEETPAFHRDEQLGIGIDEFDGLDRGEFFEQLEKVGAVHGAEFAVGLLGANPLKVRGEFPGGELVRGTHDGRARGGRRTGNGRNGRHGATSRQTPPPRSARLGTSRLGNPVAFSPLRPPGRISRSIRLRDDCAGLSVMI